jgi:hypothetical protein
MSKAFLTTEGEVWDFYLANAGTTNAVIICDRSNDLYLIYGAGEDGDYLAYQGVPEALDEHGSSVDPNHGHIAKLLAARGPLAKVYPAGEVPHE